MLEPIIEVCSRPDRVRYSLQMVIRASKQQPALAVIRIVFQSRHKAIDHAGDGANGFLLRRSNGRLRRMFMDINAGGLR